jgi:hypothetical protein
VIAMGRYWGADIKKKKKKKKNLKIIKTGYFLDRSSFSRILQRRMNSHVSFIPGGKPIIGIR